MQFEIFISYRRKGGYDTAKLVYDRLRLDGYSVSFDIDTLVNGNFDNELEQRVSDCKDFLLVLSPGVFDRFFETNPDYDPENDWVRREIACALKMDKNIIPLAMDGFAFPKSLPNDVKDIMRKNAIDLYPKYFEAAYEKMKSFMVSKPSWVVKHKKKITIAASLLIAMSLVVASFFYLDSYKSKQELQEMQQLREQRKEQRQREKTFHWNDEGDIINQVIFEKIMEAGVQKTLCSGNGLIITPNKVNCRGETEITCSYSPKISFTNCSNKPVTFLEKNERFRSSAQKDEIAAKDEIANKLRAADFGDWVSAIKGLK